MNNNEIEFEDEDEDEDTIPDEEYKNLNQDENHNIQKYLKDYISTKNPSATEYTVPVKYRKLLKPIKKTKATKQRSTPSFTPKENTQTELLSRLEAQNTNEPESLLSLFAKDQFIKIEKDKNENHEELFENPFINKSEETNPNAWNTLKINKSARAYTESLHPEESKTPVFSSRTLKVPNPQGLVRVLSAAALKTGENEEEILNLNNSEDFLLDEQLEHHSTKETRNVYGIIPSDSYISDNEEGENEADDILWARRRQMGKNTSKITFTNTSKTISKNISPKNAHHKRGHSQFHRASEKKVKRTSTFRREEPKKKKYTNIYNKPGHELVNAEVTIKDENSNTSNNIVLENKMVSEKKGNSNGLKHTKSFDFIWGDKELNNLLEEEEVDELECMGNFLESIPIPMKESEIEEQMSALLKLVDIWYPPSALKPRLLTTPLNCTPEGHKKKSLILDLDGTLIYKGVISKAPKELVQRMRILRTPNRKVCFSPRPFAQRFIQKMSKYYEIIIYSAGEKEYVNEIMRVLTHKGDLGHCVDHILHRKDCISYKNFCLKTISVMNRDPKNTIILDDNYMVWPVDLDNVIPITAFDGDRKDRELRKLLKFLVYLARPGDVRSIIGNRYQLFSRFEQYRENLQDS